MNEAPPVTATPAHRSLLNRLLGTSKKPNTVPYDRWREMLETVVFVVVLVFMLKQFVVEAFVIPTGSMAETLYGYRKQITCPECGHVFELNAHCEAEATRGPGGEMQPPKPVRGYCCPNCRYQHTFTASDYPPGYVSGDRVLVLKPIYHREKAVPGDVVVFKFPEAPQKEFSAQNYIKRMWGTGGQTIAIWRGDLYVCDSIEYPVTPVRIVGTGEMRTLYERPENPNDLWQKQYTYPRADVAMKVFNESKAAGFPEDGNGFKLIRKSDRLIGEMKRLVYDNDQQSKTLKAKGLPPRWKAEDGGWAADAENQSFTHTGGEFGWLRYRHILVENWGRLRDIQTGLNGKPVVNADGIPLDSTGQPVARLAPIDNFLGYNAEMMWNEPFRGEGPPGISFVNGQEDWRYWVGDLMLECQAKIDAADAQITLQLSKGENYFEAHFQDGKVRLTRTGPGGKELAVASSGITGPGTYTLKFANIDCRLKVWVNGKPVAFEKPVDYAPAEPKSFDRDDVKHEGWFTDSDVKAPVRVGAAGAVTVSKLKIWRDTYFICETSGFKHFPSIQNVAENVSTFYVQPGHYLCLGDNSAQSSDSREWGVVPERLMLGKAVVIFWPFDRLGKVIK